MSAKDCPYQNLKPTTVKCPICKKGVFIPKRGRFGPIYVCNSAIKPRCDIKLDSRPTGKKCIYKRDGKKCNALILEGTKTIKNRCSDRNCPNRNPHKL